MEEESAPPSLEPEAPLPSPSGFVRPFQPIHPSQSHLQSDSQTSFFSSSLPAWGRKKFLEGDDVLVAGRDGSLTFGIVVGVDPEVYQCLVRFGDCTEKWSPFYDLKKLGEPSDEPFPPPQRSLPATPTSSSAPSGVDDDDVPDALLLEEEQPALPPTRTTQRRTVLETPRPLPPQIQPHVLAARKQFLPYDFDALSWNQRHTFNEQQSYCYCGQSGTWYKKMLQCHTCLQWFHQGCLKTSTPPMLIGDRFWEFGCAICMANGKEKLRRIELGYVDAMHLVLFSLTVTNSKKNHDLENAVLPLFKRKLKSLQGPTNQLKASRIEVQFMTNLLNANKSRFKCGSESKRRHTFWGLRQIAAPLPPNSRLTDYAADSYVENSDRSTATSQQQQSETVSFNGSKTRQQRQPVAGKSGHILKPLPPKNVARKRGGRAPVGSVVSAKRSRTLRHSSSMDTACGDESTLDELVPPPKDFTGANNPFVKDIGEVPTTLGAPVSSTKSSRKFTLPPRPSTPSTPMLTSDLITVPHSTETSPSSSGVSSIEPSTSSLLGDPPNKDWPSKTPGIFVSDLKCSLSSLFGAPTTVAASSEHKGSYVVKSRRLTLDGDIQYLVERDQPGPLSPVPLTSSVQSISSIVSNKAETKSEELTRPVSPMDTASTTIPILSRRSSTVSNGDSNGMEEPSLSGLDVINNGPDSQKMANGDTDLTPNGSEEKEKVPNGGTDSTPNGSQDKEKVTNGVTDSVTNGSQDKGTVTNGSTLNGSQKKEEAKTNGRSSPPPFKGKSYNSTHGGPFKKFLVIPLLKEDERIKMQLAKQERRAKEEAEEVAKQAKVEEVAKAGVVAETEG